MIQFYFSLRFEIIFNFVNQYILKVSQPKYARLTDIQRHVSKNLVSSWQNNMTEHWSCRQDPF